MREPDLRVLHHQSRVLEGNAMGDPTERRISVYLPPGYEASARTYPVVFMLAGWSGRGTRYLNDEGVFTWRMQDRLDELILAKQMPPVIAVFPDATMRLGCSQYINSEATGRYMDYVAVELVDFIDATFRTAGTTEHRGVLGHSSGGFGALALGMLRPDRFSAIMSSAGDSWYEHLYAYGIPAMVATLEKAGGVEPFLDKYLGSPNPQGLLSRDEADTMMNLSMCPCYAPNLGVAKLKGDLYFDLNTGALIPEVFERFLAWDPVHMIDRHAGALRSLRFILLEAGTEDEFALHLGHRQLAAKLARLEIPFSSEEYPGKHGGHHYRMPDRIRRMLEVIG